jgi:ketosteroid isomerase-like protein
MKRFLLFLGFAFVISGFAFVSSTCRLNAQSTPSDSTQDSQIPVTTTDSPEIVTFQKLEDNWSISVSHRDQYGLELVLSPLFMEVSATGDISTRDQQVARLINTEDKTVTLDMHVVTVRMLGDVAVVNGTYTFHHKVNGNPAEERGVFTHVFQKVRAGWLCINSQRTQLKEAPPIKQAKKQSGSELGFHIPLFSKN